ncbi:MAG: hypothetical protein ACI9VR_002407 [Cognaticolwellia sp.]|jgi:hypothetical protein
MNKSLPLLAAVAVGALSLLAIQSVSTPAQAGAGTLCEFRIFQAHDPTRPAQVQVDEGWKVVGAGRGPHLSGEAMGVVVCR